MSNVKLKPIVDGIMDDFIHKDKSKSIEPDYRKITNIIQSRAHSVKINHSKEYSNKLGKHIVAVPKIELKRDGIKYRLSRPSSVKDPGSSIIYVDISFRPSNTRVNIDGNDLNYYLINSDFMYGIEDNLEHILKNAANYYNNLTDLSIKQILSAVLKKLSDAARSGDIHANTYINIDV